MGPHGDGYVAGDRIWVQPTTGFHKTEDAEGKREIQASDEKWHTFFPHVVSAVRFGAVVLVRVSLRLHRLTVASQTKNYQCEPCTRRHSLGAREVWPSRARSGIFGDLGVLFPAISQPGPRVFQPNCSLNVFTLQRPLLFNLRDGDGSGSGGEETQGSFEADNHSRV
ncbi:hypothetical protein F5883DRAFT_205241 [Diaporthe sp. PMI_573]|nr:hypothetical protein F5883DRAFT_205241 [Diaporthaceae sp. PMI_573]